MNVNTIGSNSAEITMSQVEDYLNYLQPYQGNVEEPDVSEMSKKCAIAIREEFMGFEGMLHTANMYFYFYEHGSSEYAHRVSVCFDRLSDYFYPLVSDMVETRLQSNWELFLHTLTSEALTKSRSEYSQGSHEKVRSYFDCNPSIEGLKKLIDANPLDEEFLSTDIKAELIYAIQYSMSGNLHI